MKEKTKKHIKGSISVLMIIILLGMMTLSAIVVDSSRINMARSMVSSAGDLAANSALADYDTILKDVYGLFAMSQNKTDEQLANEIKEYFKKTVVSYGIVDEADSEDYINSLLGDFNQLVAGTSNISTKNFLDMEFDENSILVNKVPNSSLASANIMRSQIVEYMKYRAPVNFGLSFLDSIKAFKSVQKQTSVVEKQVEAQESSQDVTAACKATIDSVRKYDKIIDYIENGTGEKAVDGITHISGKASSGDGVDVSIKDYHTQVDKYHSSWGANATESYKYINKINLVFLLKSPKVSSFYLSGLNVETTQWYVKTNGAGILYDGSGIPNNVSVSGNTDQAEQTLKNKISALEKTNGLELKTANAFPSYLSQTYLGADKTKFSNESEAIKTFIEFEKFVNNDSSATVKYNDVKTTLESLYTLGKYYDYWNGKITTDIQNAEAEMNAANQAVTTANNNASSYYTNIDNNRKYINDANINYTTSYEFLNNISNSDKENLKIVVSSLLANNNISMPTGTTSKGGKNFTDFTNFVKNNYKENGGDTDNRFLKVFKEIVNSSLKNSDDYKKICNAANSYLEDKANKKTTLSFSEYVKSKAGSSSLDNDLYKLLAHLYTNSGYVGEIESNINKYNSVVNGYAGLVQAATDATNKHSGLVNRQTTIKNDYTRCLRRYEAFGRKYQNALYNYNLYVTRANDVVTNKVGLVKTQFTNIKNNLSKIIAQLDDIITKLDTAEEKINNYITKLNTWNQENTSYASQNGSDSFSKQNKSDYETALSHYDVESLKTFREYVKVIKGEYNTLYSVITDSTHFKYGSKKIDSISTASDAVSAASSVKDKLPAVVTVDNANSQYASLYNSDASPAIVLENGLYFLNPTLPVAFLKYLNETYPNPEDSNAPSSVTAADGSTINIGSSENGDSFDYDKTVNDLSDNDDKKITDDTDKNKYGYTYENRTARGEEGADMPSQIANIANGTDKSNNTMDLDKDDNGNVDASNGISQQSGILGSLLGGIGNVVSDSIETTYILSYIFENFSYNTIVQDAVVKANSIEGTNAWTLLTNTEEKLKSGSESLNAVLTNPSKTLSNYNINGKNNYLYGSEIEYILFGNRDVKNNVTSMKASIYAIRFAFNCIFAFTDSEIRNTTMSVGLAVQAATCGIVPYQLVQVVLQLALAATESAMDLKLISNGIDVVVVKTKDTWSLSLTSAVKAAGSAVASAAANGATKAISAASSGIQGIVDASGSEIKGAVQNLQADLKTATEAKFNEVLDGAIAHIQTTIENELNKLQFINYAEDGAKSAQAELDDAFSGLSEKIKSELQTKFGGNEISDYILPHITSRIDGVLSNVKSEISGCIAGVDKSKVGDVITEKMTAIKLKLMTELSNVITIATAQIESGVNGIVDGITTEINGYIGDAADNLSEKASKEIKDKITTATNDFVDQYLSDTGTSAIGSGSTGSTSSSVASMIKFGYKEYLMLFVYVGLFVDSSETQMLTRVADVIQLNITNAGEGAEFNHNKGKAFRMSNAYTYISIRANAKLKMLFLNMDFFTDFLKDDDTDVEGQLTPNANIIYNGLLGY